MYISSLQLSKADKTIERREKQIKNLTSQLENSRQEQEAALNKANQFRTMNDNMKLEFEENKKVLGHTAKELKVCRCLRRPIMYFPLY